MKRDFFKKITFSFYHAYPVFFSVLVLQTFSYAVDVNEPTMAGLVQVFINILNWAIYLVGIVFVFVLAYGAWKGATALGDPRSLESAKSTWTYALYGAIIVVAAYGLFSLIARFFGYSFGLGSVFEKIEEGISQLINAGVNEPTETGKKLLGE